MRIDYLIGLIVLVVILAFTGMYFLSQPAKMQAVPWDSNRQPTDVKTNDAKARPVPAKTPENTPLGVSTPKIETAITPPVRRPQPDPVPVESITRPNDHATPFTPTNTPSHDIPASNPAAAATHVPPSLTDAANPATSNKPATDNPAQSPANTTPVTPTNEPRLNPGTGISPPPVIERPVERPSATPIPDRRSESIESIEPSATPSGNSPSSTPRTHTIESGDTLGKLAAEFLGDEKRWRRIKEANPGIDESRLRVGQKVVIPDMNDRNAATVRSETAKPAGTTPARTTNAAGEPAAKANSAENRPAVPATYKVEAGDGLVQIARKVLKDENRWREIFELNRDKLRDPDHLKAGTVLKMPGEKVARKPTAKPAGATPKPAARRKP